MKKIFKGLGARIGRFLLLFVPPNDSTASARSLYSRERGAGSKEQGKGRVKMALANAAEAVAGLVGMANVFSTAADELVQISPVGDFPHQRGIQRIDRKAIEAMANHFSSLKARLARRFGGVPFFVGHPDVPGLENEYPDKRAYGWIEELVAKEDGLYGRVKWSDSGKELLANAHYKFLSPFWNAETVQEGGKKYFRPVELVSVALTNKPNLPVNPLANEERKENTMERAILIALLGLANEATDEQIKTAITNNKQAAVTQAEAATALSNEKTAHGSTKSNLELQLANARTELANHKKGRIELMVDSAIKEGRVPVANRGQWIADLETDFVGKSAALANEKVTVPTQSKTGAMGNRRDPVALANEQAINRQVRALMNEKTAKGMAYDDAWALVQQERPELFKAMVQPEAAGN